MQTNVTLKGGKSLILGLSVLIIVLTLHHIYKHGYAFDEHDFQDAFFYLFKSHEGIIVILLIIMLGVYLVFA